MRSAFQKDYSLGMWQNKLISEDQRKEVSSKIRDKYPDRIPVICEKAEKTDIPAIHKKRYLVPVVCCLGFDPYRT